MVTGNFYKIHLEKQYNSIFKYTGKKCNIGSYIYYLFLRIDRDYEINIDHKVLAKAKIVDLGSNENSIKLLYSIETKKDPQH